MSELPGGGGLGGSTPSPQLMSSTPLVVLRCLSWVVRNNHYRSQLQTLYLPSYSTSYRTLSLLSSIRTLPTKCPCNEMFLAVNKTKLMPVCDTYHLFCMSSSSSMKSSWTLPVISCTDYVCVCVCVCVSVCVSVCVCGVEGLW